MSSVVSVLIRTATFLDQTLLHIVILALLTPLRRLVLTIVLFLVALFFCLVNGLTIMLSWTVNSYKLQRLGLGCVDELVLSSGWDDDDV